MSEQQFSWKTTDGLTIQGRHWPVAEPVAVICLVHGLGEHAGRYDHVGRFFNQNQMAMLAYDRRGHGKSDGKRGDAPSLEALLAEVETLLEKARQQYPGRPIFLYGHSLGGNLVLNLLLRKQPDVRGVVATGPFIRMTKSPPALQLWAGQVMSKFMPSLLQPNGLIVDGISRDPAVVEAYKADPLVHDRISVRKGLFMLDAATFLEEYRQALPRPVLLCHGSDDKLTDPTATEEFAQHVAGDVTWKKWDGLYHEIHNEPEKEAVLATILTWIKKHL